MGRGGHSSDDILFGEHSRTSAINYDHGRLGDGLDDDQILALATITKEYRYDDVDGQVEVSFSEFAKAHIQEFGIALDEAECLLAGEDVTNEDEHEAIYEHYSLPEQNREALRAQLQILYEREPENFA